MGRYGQSGGTRLARAVRAVPRGGRRAGGDAGVSCHSGSHGDSRMRPVRCRALRSLQIPWFFQDSLQDPAQISRFNRQGPPLGAILLCAHDTGQHDPNLRIGRGSQPRFIYRNPFRLFGSYLPSIQNPCATIKSVKSSTASVYSGDGNPKGRPARPLPVILRWTGRNPSIWSPGRKAASSRMSSAPSASLRHSL